MKQLQNLHIHTTYADGKDSPEEIVLSAIQKGFQSNGFSEHTYMAFSDYPYQMTVEEMIQYKAEMHRLKQKYKNQIDILCGLEYDLFSEVSVDGFDYIIDSVHYLDIDGKKVGFDRGVKEVEAFINNHFLGNGLAFAEKYFETLLLLPQKLSVDILGHFDSFENAAFICVNACVTLSGALPLMFVVSKLLNKPLGKIGSKTGIDSISAFSFLSTLVTNATTFSLMEKMNKKGVVLNAAFAVSAAFVFGSHMAFTLAFNADCILPVIVGKLVSGAAAVALALLLYKDEKNEA